MIRAICAALQNEFTVVPDFGPGIGAFLLMLSWCMVLAPAGIASASRGVALIH
jgi:hypothetical protein